MAKKIVVLVSLFIFVIGLAGCATARKQKDLEVQGLRNQISVLESQLQSRDEDINSLRDALARQEKESQEVLGKTAKKIIIQEIKSRPKIKQVQIALRNAGYEPGAIDGKMGRQTRDAIKAFQKANKLHADGKVGKETWALLKAYLYKKIK